MTTRREFITLLGGAAGWPVAARAQQSEQVRRIGFLVGSKETDTEAQAIILALRKRLRELGWTDGRNVQIVPRWATGDDPARVGSDAAEMVSLKPEVIFCRSTPVVAALQHATRAIPIVFINANDPIGSGFVASLARPGGNITGFISFEPAIGGKWLNVLRELAPGIACVALIFNPKTHTGQHFGSIESASQSLGINLIRVAFHDAVDLARGIDNFAREPNGGLLVLPDISTILNRDLIVTLAVRYRLPAIYPFRDFMAAGGLVYYGTDQKDLAAKAAEYVDRILKGEKPADLPVQAPTKLELVINLKTAQTLGVDVSLQLQQLADEVIE